MRPFVHLTAKSVKQAVALLAEYPAGRARLNAGGTDLFGLMKDEFLPEHPEAVIDIKAIPGLDYLKEERGVLRIGALARLVDLARSPLLLKRYRLLADAARSVASPQIRNVASIGGNLCQDVRCCYYRYPRHIGGPIQCARKGKGPCLAVKGDNRYHAILEGRRCFAVCPSDTAVALAALDAVLVLTGPQGERRVPVRGFYTPLGNALGHGEMMREIEIPALREGVRQTFLKFSLRRPIDFAVVSVAALSTVVDGVCREARIALGAVAPGPVRAEAAEEYLKGRALDEASAVRAAEIALSGARPLSGNAYKVEIANALVKRAILGQDEEYRHPGPAPEGSGYDPTELSTFHRCSSGNEAASTTVVG